MNTRPKILVWQEVSNTCRMAVQLDWQDEFRFTLGDPRTEELTIVFERHALERLIQLGSRALTQQRPPSSTLDSPEMVSAV